ncbi:unnamed protein product [Trifolium pratense]|uniref:Uncharacterized protein n=1 Tax=Trifolium pratense TaxID=57577 RepID=A0ACB0IHE2_TRIPR|nr:unnamed protein product [Trifolium pratense]
MTYSGILFQETWISTISYLQNSGDSAINNYKNEAKDHVKDDKSDFDDNLGHNHNSNNPTFTPDNVVESGLWKTAVHSNCAAQQCYSVAI